MEQHIERLVAALKEHYGDKEEAANMVLAGEDMLFIESAAAGKRLVVTTLVAAAAPQIVEKALRINATMQENTALALTPDGEYITYQQLFSAHMATNDFIQAVEQFCQESRRYEESLPQDSQETTTNP